MANPLFSISQANYLQRQNLPTTINFDWLNPQQPVQSQNQGGFLNLQPYNTRQPKTFIEMSEDGTTPIQVTEYPDGRRTAVAGVSETAVTPATQQATEQQAQSVQQQPVQPAETTTATTTNAPVQSATDVINKVQPPQNKPLKLFETPKTLQPEVNQNILNTIPEGYYNKVNTQPLLNTSDLELAMQLGNLKQQHYARDLIIGTLDDQLNSGNLTEDQKKKALDAKNYYQNEQDQIHQYAEMLRNGSGSNVDWSNYGFGSDDNLAQTQVSLYNQQRRNLQRFLNLPTAAETEQKSFNDYRNQGYNSWQARIMAQEDAANARNENSRNYANAMNFYGINSDGSLNSMGVELANRWAKDDPQSAGIYLQSYALPNTQFNARVNLANSALSQEHADWRSILNAALQGYGIDVRNKQVQKALEETIRQNNLNYGLNKDRIGIAQEKLKLDTQRAQADAIYKQQSLYAKTPIGKMQGTYEALLALGYSEADAAEMTRQSFVNSLLPDNGKAFKNDKDLENALDSILYLVETGEEDTAGQTLQNILSKREDDPVKFYSKTSPEMRAKADKIFNATQKYLDFSGNSTDTKAREDSKIKLQAEIRAALDPKGRPASEFEQAIRYARAAQRHNLDGKPATQADEKVKALLKEGGAYDEKTNTYQGNYSQNFLPFNGKTFQQGWTWGGN